MAIRSINNTFNRGQLDPTLLARDDLDLYTKGAQVMQNMVALWTGAAQIAPGTRYIDTIIDRENGNAPILDSTLIKGFDFTFNAAFSVIYTIILRPSGTNVAFDIYFQDTLQATVVSTLWLASQIPNIHFATSNDRVLILHELVHTAQLRRGTTHALWNITLFTPRVFPTYDFSVIGTAVNYQNMTFTLSGTTGAITINASGGVFTANHVGGLFRALGGVARITAVTTGLIAQATVIDPFTATSYAGNLISLSEKIWNSDTTTLPASDFRGWPSRGNFYLNRLILGRSLAVKNLVNVSTAGVYDNFDDSDLDGTVAFSATFNGKGEQSVESIIADDSILFTTSNKLFAQSPLVESPLTINNVYFSPQSQCPACSIEAVSIDNQTLFVSENRTKVMQAVYSTADGKYITYPATMLSNSLVQRINSNATWEPQSIATLLYLATQDNGTMLLFSTLQNQNVAAWSIRDTTGYFRQVIGDGRQSHVVVEREVNTGSVYGEHPDYAFLSDPTFGAKYNITNIVQQDVITSSVPILENQNDYMVIGNIMPFTSIQFTVASNASSNCQLQMEYLDLDGNWNLMSHTDTTNGFTSSGALSWVFDSVQNWAPNTFGDINKHYWIRIKRLAPVVASTPFISQSKINTSKRMYLERQSFSYYTDSTRTGTSDINGMVSGLNSLAGQRVFARINGATVGYSFVNQDGTTFIRGANAQAEIGIEYKPVLSPMPIYAPTAEGDSLYSQKHVQDLYIDYVDSLYLQAGFYPTFTNIPNMHLGDYTLGTSVPPQTGVYRLSPRGGWEPRNKLIITQSQPGPMVIIGVGYNVEVS